MQQWATTRTATGSTETISQKINTYAEVTRMSGSRSSLNGQTQLQNIFKFRIRFQQFDPTGNWRIIYDRRKFTVHSIEKENQMSFYWIIIAEALGKR